MTMVLCETGLKGCCRGEWRLFGRLSQHHRQQAMVTLRTAFRKYTPDYRSGVYVMWGQHALREHLYHIKTLWESPGYPVGCSEGLEKVLRHLESNGLGVTAFSVGKTKEESQECLDFFT